MQVELYRSQTCCEIEGKPLSVSYFIWKQEIIV